MKQAILIPILLGVTLFQATAGAMTYEGKTTVRRAVYQTLVERETVSTCFITTWRGWFKGDVNYGVTDLVKIWLEDENGNLIKGSLENIAQRRASAVSTDRYVDREDAVPACEQESDKLKIDSYSAAEAQEIIRRFLKSAGVNPASK